MEGKEKLLSDAKGILIEDEKLRAMLKEGNISQGTYDNKHSEITVRLGEIKEQISALDRKKTELSKPASVENFNNSFLKRHVAKNNAEMAANVEPLSNVGMAAVFSFIAIVLLLLSSSSLVFSSLPALPEPYALEESAKMYAYLTALCVQMLIGGFFLWFMARITRIKRINHYKARICATSGALVSSGSLSVGAYLAQMTGYASILQGLGYLSGLLAYYFAIRTELKADRLTSAFHAITIYAVNYALAAAVMLSIIILL